MSLLGQGAIAIWNDITDEGRTEFYEWHDREHIPERVSIPGFLRGRRLIALRGEPEYFTFYEVTDRSVLTSDDYKTRLNSPTEWTTRAVAHFRHTARSLCEVRASLGSGAGGVVGTIRFDCDADADGAIRDALTHGILDEAAGSLGICGVHLCQADVEASNVKTAEQRGRDANMVPRWVIVVEGATEQSIEDVFAGCLSASALQGLGAGEVVQGIYQLQHDLIAAR